MKFAICNEIFQGQPIEDAIRQAADWGYDALELAPFTLANSVRDIPATRRAAIRSLAERARLDISGIHWVLVKPEGLYINHSNPSIRRQTAEYFCDLVDFCADLGGRFMVVGSPKQRSILEGVTRQQAWDWALETFRVAVQRAATRQVTICLEPLSTQETNFLNTAAETIEFTRQLAHDRFKIMLDVKAMCSETKPVPQIIRESWPHFAYFHANDRNLKGPGFGDVDYRPIASALKQVGYSGYVSVEVFQFEEGAETIGRRSLDYLRRVFA